MGIYHHANFQGNARGFGTKSLIKLQEKVDLQTGPWSQKVQNNFTSLRKGGFITIQNFRGMREALVRNP